MKHARTDYDRIQDPLNLIDEDEPVFLIRGQDVTGGRTVFQWALNAFDAGAADDIILAAVNQALLMRVWAGDYSKTPDMPLADPSER